jgi:hypothetical protein
MTGRPKLTPEERRERARLAAQTIRIFPCAALIVAMIISIAPETPSEWFHWVKEWFENISWLWVTMLVPLGLWAWHRFWKKSSPESRPDARAKG